MAFGGSRLCCFPCWNLSPINFIKDELARDPGPANNFYLDSFSLAPSCNPTPDLILVPALIPALVPALAPILPSSNELFRQFMKVYLETNQRPK